MVYIQELEVFRGGVTHVPDWFSHIVLNEYLRSQRNGFDYIDISYDITVYNVSEMIRCLKALAVQRFTISNLRKGIGILSNFNRAGYALESEIVFVGKARTPALALTYCGS